MKAYNNRNERAGVKEIYQVLAHDIIIDGEPFTYTQFQCIKSHKESSKLSKIGSVQTVLTESFNKHYTIF